MARGDLGAVTRGTLLDIADAIRAQTGLTKLLTPPEMADAILSIEPIQKTYYGLLLKDGTLELCYRAEPVSRLGEVDQAFEVNAAGYTYSGRPPWNDRRGEVKRCVMDPSLRLAPITSAAHLLAGCNLMKTVEGLENLQHAGVFDYLFYDCRSVVSIYASRFDGTKVASQDGVFSGCDRLIGGHGKAKSAITKDTDLSLGEAGLLTDPENDRRRWFWSTLYEDGELVLSATEALDADRVYVVHEPACANIVGASLKSFPWGSKATLVKRATVLPDMSAIDAVSPGNWFMGCTALTAVSGMGNLAGARSLTYTFGGCTLLTEVDLRGFDPSHLEEVIGTFYECRALSRILASPNWELPAGIKGYYTFMNCTSLVGGNGTKFSASNADYRYFRLDTADSPGYLTLSE